MSSIIETSTLLQNWTELGGVESRGNCGECIVDLAPERIDGRSIRFARAARRSSEVGSFLLSSFKGRSKNLAGQVGQGDVNSDG